MATSPSRLLIGRLLLQNKHCKEKYMRRLFCSRTRRKPRIMSKEERTDAVKLFVERYMLQFPGKFPSSNLVRQEVGGSWDILKKVLGELKTIKTSQDQKQSADVYEESFEAVKSVAPESLSTDAKSNDTTIMESNDSKQNTLLHFNDLPDNKKETLSQSSNKELVAQSFSSGSLYPMLSGKLDGENEENTTYKRECSVDAPCPEESSGTNLPDNQEKALLHSSDEKQKPVAFSATGESLLPLSSLEIALEKVDNNACNQINLSVHPNGLSSTSIDSKNLELANLRGSSVAASSSINKIEIENNANKRTTPISIIRSLCASRTPKEEMSEQTKEGGSGRHARDVTHSFKVENKEVEQKSNVLEVLGRLSTEAEAKAHTKKLNPTKQLHQDQRNRMFPFTSSILFDKTRDEVTDDDSDFAAFDYPEPGRGDRPMIPQGNFRLDKLGLSEKPKIQQCVLVKFLPYSATEHDLHKAFGDCGSMDRVKIIQSRREESRFNYASIIFKTEEAFQKALMKKDVVVHGGDLVLEAASSRNQNLCEDLVPRAKENNAVPLIEIKNPSRTVMIKDLPNGIGFRHLKSALAFCGTVSNFLMGSSNSTMYVEFETEDAKERALMAHWICVDGQQLQIRRVDAPRTPVVRISNVSSDTSDTKILNICESFGFVKRVERRDKDIVDVHFKQTEICSMIKILDSLNGVIMNQCRWQAQPAPVFPPETLQVLWRSADGRMYLQSVIQNLFRVISKIDSNENDFKELASQYYGETINRKKQL